jgi:hypothetical protein
MNGSVKTLDEQLEEYARQPFLAMPIAGATTWCVIGVAGAFLPIGQASWVLFIGTGTIYVVSIVVLMARLRTVSTGLSNPARGVATASL